MEILIAFVIASLAARYAASDVAYAVRGKASPRHQLAMKRMEQRAARTQARSSAKQKPHGGRDYLAGLWHDSWHGALSRHNRRVAKREHKRARIATGELAAHWWDRPGPARGFGRGVVDDWRGAYAKAWERAAEKRTEKRAERRHKTETGPQTPPVTPTLETAPEAPEPPTPVNVDAVDFPDPETVEDDHDENAGTDRPPLTLVPEPATNSSSTNGGTETPAAHATGTTTTTNGSTDENGATPMNTTTETSNAEVLGLDQAIQFCEQSKAAAESVAPNVEQVVASLEAGNVGGEVAAKLHAAAESQATAAALYGEAAKELASHKGVQERYDATPGAGSKEFVTAGR